MSNFHAYGGDKPYIFISYSHKDSNIVMQIVDQMISDGYRVWYDEGISPGTHWDDFIAAKIDNSGLFIAFISENYLESDNCKDELNYSKDHIENVLLVYISEVNLSSGMELRFGRTQAVLAYNYSCAEDFFAKLYSTNGLEYFNDNIVPGGDLILEEEIASKEDLVAEGDSDYKEPVATDNITKRNSNKKTILPIVISGIVIILLAAVVIIVVNKYGKKEITEEENTYVSDTGSDTISDTVSDTIPDGYSSNHLFETFNLKDGESYYKIDDDMNFLNNTGAVYLGYLEGENYQNGTFYATDTVSVRVPTLNGYSEEISICWYYIDENNNAKYLCGDFDIVPTMVNDEMCYVSSVSGSVCDNGEFSMGTYYVSICNPSDGTELTVTRFFYTKDSL